MNVDIYPSPPTEGAVDDYISNRLSQQDAARFEEYCLRDPQFARRVELEIALKLGFRRAEDAPAGAPEAVRNSRWLTPFLAIAAGLVLIAVSLRVVNPPPGLAGYKSMADLPVDLQHAPISHAALFQLRGDDSVTELQTTGDGLVDVQFLPELTLAARDYRLEIAPVGLDQSPLVINGLRVSSDGYLHAYLAGSQVLGKSWTFTLAPNPIAGPEHRQAFRVRFVPAGAAAQ